MVLRGPPRCLGRKELTGRPKPWTLGMVLGLRSAASTLLVLGRLLLPEA